MIKNLKVLSLCVPRATPGHCLFLVSMARSNPAPTSPTPFSKHTNFYPPFDDLGSDTPKFGSGKGEDSRKRASKDAVALILMYITWLAWAFLMLRSGGV